jgi:branched-chain amino acid transport system substrate-binding protein
MLMRMLLIAVLALGLGAPAGSVSAQDKVMFVPLLVYRTGPFAPNGIPSANGFND